MSSAIAQPERSQPESKPLRRRRSGSRQAEANLASGAGGGAGSTGLTGGGAGGESEQRDLASLMDDILGNARGVVLGEIGPTAVSRS